VKPFSYCDCAIFRLSYHTLSHKGLYYTPISLFDKTPGRFASRRWRSSYLAPPHMSGRQGPLQSATREPTKRFSRRRRSKYGIWRHERCIGANFWLTSLVLGKGAKRIKTCYKVGQGQYYVYFVSEWFSHYKYRVVERAVQRCCRLTSLIFRCIILFFTYQVSRKWITL
jgi:hypothetical protein